MGENVLEFTDSNFNSEVLQSGIPVLVDFWAEWCGPCKAIAPTVGEIANDYNGKIKVGKVNVDTNQKIAMEYGIRSIPSLLFFNNGEVVEQKVGAVSKDELTSVLDKLIKG